MDGNQQPKKEAAMRYLVILLLVPSVSFSQTFFEKVNEFLVDNVKTGTLDYQHLKQNPQNLDEIVLIISEFLLEDQDSNFKTAFYINAYNMLVIKQVRDNYPIESPLDVDGFFKKKKFLVAREMLSLDEIEFLRLIGPTKDPRIHFALGCAALSCPYLYDQAYIPAHLQQQLEFRAQLVIGHPSYVEVDNGKRTVFLNKIFEWYADQFVFTGGSLLSYVNMYRFYEVPQDYKVQFKEYDWALNSN